MHLVRNLILGEGEEASCLEDRAAFLVDQEACLEGHSFQVVGAAFPCQEVEVAYPYLGVEEAFPSLVEEEAYPFRVVEEVMNHLTTLRQEEVEEAVLTRPCLEEGVVEGAFPSQEEVGYLQAVADIDNRIVI